MKRINKLNLNASINPVSYVKETQIEEVIITVPKRIWTHEKVLEV